MSELPPSIQKKLREAEEDVTAQNARDVGLPANKYANSGKVSNRRDKRLKHQPYEKWSDDKKQQAAIYYRILGSFKQVEKYTGIPSATIAQWQHKEWWQDLQHQLREQHDNEIDIRIGHNIDQCLDNITQRLEEGDEIYDTKNGRFINKKVSALDTARIAGILYDKRALIRGLPTAISGTNTVDERLKKLGDAFERFTKAKEIDDADYKVVDTISESDTIE